MTPLEKQLVKVAYVHSFMVLVFETSYYDGLGKANDEKQKSLRDLRMKISGMTPTEIYKTPVKEIFGKEWSPRWGEDRFFGLLTNELRIFDQEDRRDLSQCIFGYVLDCLKES